MGKMKIPKNCWIAYHRRIGTPPPKPHESELTPNQIAELEMSRQALERIQAEEAKQAEEIKEAERAKPAVVLQRKNGRVLLPFELPGHVETEPQSQHPKETEEERAWGLGWRTAFYGSFPGRPDFAETPLRKYWQEGFNEGGKAKTILDGPPRGAEEITDLEEMRQIWSLHKRNGGKLSFIGIEKDWRFNLRRRQGKTAYQVCKNYERIKRNMGVQPKPEKKPQPERKPEPQPQGNGFASKCPFRKGTASEALYMALARTNRDMALAEIAAQAKLPEEKAKMFLIGYRNPVHNAPLRRIGIGIVRNDKGYRLALCEAEPEAKRSRERGEEK